MRIRFYRESESSEPHIFRHQVMEDEVEAVLKAPFEDRAGYDGARVAIGKSEGGRFLKVIYVPEHDPPSAFVITAYELSGKPLKAFKRRQRRRRKQ